MQAPPTTDRTGPSAIGDEASSAPSGRSSGHRWVLVLAGLLLLALALLRFAVVPDARGYGTHEQLGLPPCTLLAVTGLPCPGCGVTTSMALSLHGRISEALANQPFGVLVVAAIPLFALWIAWGHVRGRDRYLDLQAALRRRVWLGALGMLVVCWVWKIAHTL